MRRTICAFVSLAGVAIISLTVDVSCQGGAEPLCRGTAVNSLRHDSGELDDHCTECVEATCCDLIGDCQSTGCAGEVAAAHQCVIDKKRLAAAEEDQCRAKLVRADGKVVYQCMRDNCGAACALPTCKLKPLVPLVGTRECDNCFAQSCCDLMNECSENRACLLGLRCIVERCQADFARDLRLSAHPQAVVDRDRACGDGGSNDPPGSDENCFARCTELTAVAGPREEVQRAACLLAQIGECGASVDCGVRCAEDGGANEAGNDAGNDSGNDAKDAAND